MVAPTDSHTVCPNVGGNGKERIHVREVGKIIDVSLSPNQRWEIVEHKVYAYAHHIIPGLVLLNEKKGSTA